MKHDYIAETLILGVWLTIAASFIDIKVVVNVTDKPIITGSEDVRNIIKNGERD